MRGPVLDFLKAGIDHAEAGPRLAHSLAFAEVDGTTNASGYLVARHRGMLVGFNPDEGRGWVKGSLHTFAHGDNLGRFTAAQVPTAVAELSEALNMPPDWLAIKRLEMGLNLPSAESPLSFLESLSSHRQTRFLASRPPAHAAQSLEFCAYHSEYYVKLYDKGRNSQLEGRPLPSTAAPHLLRYELAFRCSRPLRQLAGVPILTLAHLEQRPILTAFAEHLAQHWHLTQHHSQMDYHGLSLSEAALLYAASDVAFWKAMRATQDRRTYERNRAKALRLFRERSQPNPYDDIFTRELTQVMGQ